MAGTNENFDAAAFRDGIKLAMHMGLPTLNSKRATFRWNPERTYTVEDRNNHPYNWTDTPVTDVSPADVQVDVAVEFKPRAQGGQTETLVGQLNIERAIVTVLDTDFAAVEGANQVLLGENVYTINYWAPELGLFDVTIHQAYVTAVDES